MRKLIKVADQKYVSEDFWMMRREWGDTPNGNPLGGRWVLRDEKGNWIDFDQYSNDLAERNDCVLVHRSEK